MLIALCALLLADAGQAQVRPVPGPGDPRLRTVEYRADQVVQLEVAAGYQLSIEFAPDERIESVAVGDSTAWLVTSTKRGAHLFIKATQAGAETNMMVITDTRVYQFDLLAVSSPAYDTAYSVRFTFDADDAITDNQTSDTAAVSGSYRVSGDRRLRPSQIGDDGQQTFIEWPSDVALPAIYTIDERGQERLVNGAMRDGLFVVDSVSPRLVFRIDNRSAQARRLVPKEDR
ncbi:TrbG/VirB9 family P-type conjugative transfer protein [Blastomonas sp.]|uniref:TrbG/VirB9 family P-type conjugative transfer protein n=1 Tax=Blastomonas sp. TaxID=1909299 RepID=UPI003593B045